jgi:hypothetical protein
LENPIRWLVMPSTNARRHSENVKWDSFGYWHAIYVAAYKPRRGV